MFPSERQYSHTCPGGDPLAGHFTVVGNAEAREEDFLVSRRYSVSAILLFRRKLCLAGNRGLLVPATEGKSIWDGGSSHVAISELPSSEVSVCLLPPWQDEKEH